MLDPWNPSPKELRAWAFQSDTPWPDQDPELAISGIESLDPLVLELAQDDRCPKQEFFLGVLLFAVGDAFFDGSEAGPDRAQRLVDLATGIAHPWIREWRRLSVRLIGHPSLFEYDSWCGGELLEEVIGKRTSVVSSWIRPQNINPVLEWIARRVETELVPDEIQSLQDRLTRTNDETGPWCELDIGWWLKLARDAESEKVLHVVVRLSPSFEQEIRTLLAVASSYTLVD